MDGPAEKSCMWCGLSLPVEKVNKNLDFFVVPMFCCVYSFKKKDTEVRCSFTIYILSKTL